MPANRNEQLFSIVSHSKLDKAIVEFVVSRQAGGCSPRTVQYYRDELGWLRDFLERQEVQQVEHITAHHIRSYLLEMGVFVNRKVTHLIIEK